MSFSIHIWFGKSIAYLHYHLLKSVDGDVIAIEDYTKHTCHVTLKVLKRAKITGQRTSICKVISMARDSHIRC